MRLLAGVAAALLLLPGCGAGDDGLHVFASASLSEAATLLAAAFEEAHEGVDVELQVAGTPVLVEQLARGAPAGVFAAADEASMARVVDLGDAAGEPRVLATNRLVVVVAPGNPEAVSGLADLARTDLVVALAAPEVPAGRYARQALRRAGVVARPDTLEPSVKAIVAKVALGEVDAGVVYRTDALAAAGRVAAVPLPTEHDVHAVLSIVALERGGVAAEAFVAFALSDRGRSVLEGLGFGVPAVAS